MPRVVKQPCLTEWLSNLLLGVNYLVQVGYNLDTIMSFSVRQFSAFLATASNQKTDDFTVLAHIIRASNNTSKEDFKNFVEGLATN